LADSQTDKWQETVFAAIGSPLSGGGVRPDTKIIDDCFDFAFENRIGLLFLERCVALGATLSEVSQGHLDRLNERRRRTESVMVRLSEILQKKVPNKWVLFKSVKPFPSTPNDTDWFPFDIKRHGELVNYLLENGFKFLEKAPMQTTLIAEEGEGIAHSDKRGGVYYIDCYQAPSADHFIYLDPAKMEKHFTLKEVTGTPLPALAASGELVAILFHNVFPEKTYSVESFFLTLHYLAEIERDGQLDDFIATVRENCVERAVSANLAITAWLHERYFGSVPPFLDLLLKKFPSGTEERVVFEAAGGQLPYNFSNGCFWKVFFEKLRDPLSLRSAFVQAFHMLNPVFFFDVMRIIWKRTRKGGIYKQM